MTAETELIPVLKGLLVQTRTSLRECLGICSHLRKNPPGTNGLAVLGAKETAAKHRGDTKERERLTALILDKQARAYEAIKQVEALLEELGVPVQEAGEDGPPVGPPMAGTSEAVDRAVDLASDHEMDAPAAPKSAAGGGVGEKAAKMRDRICMEATPEQLGRWATELGELNVALADDKGGRTEAGEDSRVAEILAADQKLDDLARETKAREPRFVTVPMHAHDDGEECNSSCSTGRLRDVRDPYPPGPSEAERPQ